MHNDPTEGIRKEMIQEINLEPGSREALEIEHGQVWDTQELQRDFLVEGFMAPFCLVTRQSDKARGTVLFQHSPRFYFSFQAA